MRIPFNKTVRRTEPIITPSRRGGYTHLLLRLATERSFIVFPLFFFFSLLHQRNEIQIFFLEQESSSRVRYNCRTEWTEEEGKFLKVSTRLYNCIGNTTKWIEIKYPRVYNFHMIYLFFPNCFSIDFFFFSMA